MPSSLDDPTISVLALKGSTGTWNITSNTKIKGRLVIENGCTVHVNGATVEFADMDQLTDVDNVVANSLDYGIEVEPGGKLILSNGAILTSSAACESYWRGVHLQASSTPDQSTPSTIGILEMDDSRIQNAICGVSVEGGGLITCTNTDSASYDNFLNNRKGVAFYPFSTANASSFNTVNFNFISPSAVKDFGNIGLNTHCSMYGVENVIFNGCSFKNEYTGPFRLGFGLASFDATYQVLNGNDITVSQPCGPIGRNSTFENLAIGIISDRTPSTSPTNFIGVAEADFINCGIAWQCDQDVSPLMYKNNITWNDDLDDYPMPNGIECIGYRSDSTIDSKLHENTFSTSGSLPYGYGIMVYDGGNSVKSLVRKNTFTKNTGTNQFHSGIWTAYDNGLFELKCNIFNNMSYYDWYNNGTMNDQGSGSVNPGNEFSSSVANSNIYSVYGSFTHYYKSPDQNPTFSGYANPGSVTSLPSCNDLDPCDVYSNISTTIDDKFVLNSLPMPLLLKKPEEIIWDNIRNKNFDEASDLTNQLPEGDYKDFLNIAIDILSTKRETNPTQKEVESLKKIALTENEASINARHFLSFFLGILIPTKMEDRLIPETQKATPGLNTMKELNRLMVYPNPTTGLVTFEWSNEPHAGNIKTISIMDISGKVVVELNNLGAAMKQEIDFKSQPNGIYFYKIMDEKGNFKTGKLSISK